MGQLLAAEKYGSYDAYRELYRKVHGEYPDVPAKSDTRTDNQNGGAHERQG